MLMLKKNDHSFALREYFLLETVDHIRTTEKGKMTIGYAIIMSLNILDEDFPVPRSAHRIRYLLFYCYHWIDNSI